MRELAATGEMLVATHLPFPSVGHVAVDGDSFRWVPVFWDYLTACWVGGRTGTVPPRPQVLKKLLFQHAARLNEQAAIDRLV